MEIAMLLVEIILILVGVVHITELHQTRKHFRQEVAELVKGVRDFNLRAFSNQPAEAEAPLVEIYPLPRENPVRGGN